MDNLHDSIFSLILYLIVLKQIETTVLLLGFLIRGRGPPAILPRLAERLFLLYLYVTSSCVLIGYVHYDE